MTNIFVRPAALLDAAGKAVPGQTVLVRDPQTKKPLAAGGEWKTRDQFWLRRIRDQDVIDGTADQEKLQADGAAKDAADAAAKAAAAQLETDTAASGRFKRS